MFHVDHGRILSRAALMVRSAELEVRIKDTDRIDELEWRLLACTRPTPLNAVQFLHLALVSHHSTRASVVLEKVQCLSSTDLGVMARAGGITEQRVLTDAVTRTTEALRAITGQCR